MQSRSGGNRYVLSMIDHVTLCSVLTAARNQEASTSTRQLTTNAYYRCASCLPLEILHSDQGIEFEI